jgi:pyrroline-5-carboxylate reductase
MKKIGFIGAGNMGLPLLIGATKLLGAEQLTFFCADEFSNKRAHETTGVEQAESLEKLVQTSECVLLAVKPQSFGEVLPVIKENTFDGQMIISLAPGVTVDYLSNETGGKTKIVRTMPNTPAMVFEGMTAICFGSNACWIVGNKLCNGEW